MHHFVVKVLRDEDSFPDDPQVTSTINAHWYTDGVRIDDDQLGFTGAFTWIDDVVGIEDMCIGHHGRSRVGEPNLAFHGYHRCPGFHGFCSHTHHLCLLV